MLAAFTLLGGAHGAHGLCNLCMPFGMSVCVLLAIAATCDVPAHALSEVMLCIATLSTACSRYVSEASSLQGLLLEVWYRVCIDLLFLSFGDQGNYTDRVEA